MKMTEKDNKKQYTAGIGNKKRVILHISMIMKGFASAVALAAAGVIISGLLLIFTSMNMDTSVVIIMVFVTAGASVSGFTAAAAAGKRGMITGMAAGLIYISIILTIFVFIAGTGLPSPERVILMAIPAAASAAAGILGVGRN